MNGLQLLASGQSTQGLAAAENLWLHSKVYSRGGENSLHAHLTEDHAFFVLQGAAVFTLGDGETVATGRFEGIMIPKGTTYKFEADGSENLVMLRIGGAVEQTPYVRASFGADEMPGAGQHNVVDAVGRPIAGTATAQKGKTPAEPVVPLPGRTFPEDGR